MVVAGTDDASPASRALATANVPPRARRVLQNQLQTASSELRQRLLAVLMETEIVLGHQRDHSTSPKLKMTASESTGLLRAAESALVASFLQEIEVNLARLHAPRDSRSLEDFAAPSQELSLVDDSETNEGGMLATIAMRSDARNSLALQLMGYRYGVLAGAPAFEAEHLPLGPHALCHALRNAANAAELPSELRLLVYSQFEKVAMSHYPELVDTLNASLAAEGVLPHLNFVPVRLGPATDATAARSVDVTGELALSPMQGNAMTSGWSNQGGQNDRGAGRASLPAGSAPHQAYGFGLLQDLLARRRVLLEKLRRGSGNDVQQRGRAQLAHDEVLDSLRRLRKSSSKPGSAKPGSLVDIRQTLLAQARQLHGHGVSLADADSDSFELFSLFMSQLQREMREGPGATLVERLKVPLLQLALREQRFFVDPDHPARKLLEAVSLAGASWLSSDDMDAQWLGMLQRAVTRVQDDPEATLDTFIAANQLLQEGLLAATRKNEMAERRQVEAARGREKMDVSRQRAASEIASLLDGRPLPRFHSVLLEHAWADVLSLTLLRHGEDSNNWRELRAATAKIVEACTTREAKTVDHVFEEQLQAALGQVGYHAKDASLIARQLANGRAEDVDAASRTELIVQIRARARLGDVETSKPLASRPARTLPEQAAYATLASSTGARWLDLHDSDENRVIRRRLAWVSPRSGHALVLNRRGQRAASEDLDSLARMMAAGLLRVIASDVHPAEAAWKATLSNLARVAGDGDVKESKHG
ncbi:MAG: DUF1631 domain-containing protein [Pseudomonadota bacterium]|nr:DUF1631 domain-containing protein [Pseudomonadota bacterium]MDQ3160601.1 DUF1631 domain-containing protein [Pseudomonadota bacterium]